MCLKYLKRLTKIKKRRTGYSESLSNLDRTKNNPQFLFYYYFLILIFLFVLFFFLFRTIPAAYGSSQARGWIWATCAGICHSHMGSKLHLQPTPQLTATLDPFTHWVRTGIKHTSLWIVVGFITAKPQQEFPFLFLFLLFCFLWLHLWHMEVLKLGVKLELQLMVYATATAIQELSCICDQYWSSQQCWILNQMRKARDWTHILMDTSL